MSSDFKSLTPSVIECGIGLNKINLPIKLILKIIVYLITLTFLHEVDASTGKKGQYESFLREFINRSVSKFVLKDILTIPFNAKHCNVYTTIEEAYEIPCRLFDLTLKSYNSNEVSFYMKFHSIHMEKLFKENKDFSYSLDGFAKGVVSREDSLALGERGYKNTERFRDRNEKERDRIGCDKMGEHKCSNIEPRINIYPYKSLSPTISGIKEIEFGKMNVLDWIYIKAIRN